MKTSLDARGLACPLPVVKANEALAGMTGGTLEVHADNAVAVENLKRLAAQRGLNVAVTQPEDAHFIVAMTVGEGAPVAAQAEDTCLPYRRNAPTPWAAGATSLGACCSRAFSTRSRTSRSYRRRSSSITVGRT